MLEHPVVYLPQGVFLIDKKNQTIDTCNCLDESQDIYAVGKKPISKSYILHYSICIPFQSDTIKN
jgi:hypothetical protein